MQDLRKLSQQYKLESLSLLPDYCLQEIFSRKIKNSTVAKILFLLSKSCRDKVLQNINSIRSKEVTETLHKIELNELEVSFSSFEKNCEALLDRVQNLKDQGIIKIPEGGVDNFLFDTTSEFNDFSDALPRFNYYQNDLHDLISWWNLAAKNIKTIFGKKVQIEDLILQRLEDEFSLKAFSLAISDKSEAEVVKQLKTMRDVELQKHQSRLDLCEEFFLAILKDESNKTLASNLSLYFENPQQKAGQIIKNGPLLLIPSIKSSLPPEDIAVSLYKLKLIFDENDIDEIEKLTSKSDEYYFIKSLSIIRAEIAAETACRIISERKKSHAHETEIKLKMICDAVTCIRNNVSLFVMLEMMSSYTVYDFQE